MTFITLSPQTPRKKLLLQDSEQIANPLLPLSDKINWNIWLQISVVSDIMGSVKTLQVLLEFWEKKTRLNEAPTFRLIPLSRKVHGAI